ncbi:hypothetical protein MPH61_00695 [Peribacillus muralis]|uniref:hypothetical protein n=1 Tax=Peribacillus muralis TaxID=264697 RepID=UPI001F4E58A4|nr:hypothetical protein [Peribacillus muralis]MCK1991109.1 hypothetical protein [Peribacillus muralis]MCK2011663.1 hypothetical protein [Peribacillus muralis]
MYRISKIVFTNLTGNMYKLVRDGRDNMKDTGKQESLLQAYLSIWNNRRVTDGGGADVLSELIRRELLDENAHPRARKAPLEKFYLCIKRVMESPLSEDKKNALIIVYIAELEKL